MAVIALGTSAAACGTSQAAASHSAISNPKPQPSLDLAISRAAHLGPAGAETEVNLSLGLKVHPRQLLASLLAQGKTVTPAVYNAEFGLDPALVQPAVAALDRAGFRAAWQPGSGLIAADGPAPAAALFLGVDIENYRLPDGTAFYASVDQPRLPPALEIGR